VGIIVLPGVAMLVQVWRKGAAANHRISEWFGLERILKIILLQAPCCGHRQHRGRGSVQQGSRARHGAAEREFPRAGGEGPQRGNAIELGGCGPCEGWGTLRKSE